MARKEKSFMCVLCGIKFKSRHLQSYFCSRKCSGVYSNEKKKYPELDMTKILDKIKLYKSGKGNRAYDQHGRLKYKKTCENCSKKFLAGRKKAKYCDNDCTIKAQNKTRKQKLSNRTFQKILKRAFSDWQCPFCTWKKTFATHHILHKSKGGDENTMNLIMICPNHHSEVHLPDGHGNKKITELELKRYSVGQYYTGEELMEKFYYGNEANKFEKEL